MDGVFTGLMQGLSTLPGVSRAGTSATALIWRKFDPESAFDLSFLLSIPTVALTEVVFYLGKAAGHISVADGAGLTLFSCAFGYMALDVMLRLVKRINIAHLTLVLGIVMMASAAFNAG